MRTAYKLTKEVFVMVITCFLSLQAPTWRLWGEEKCDGAIYTVYLKKVRYHHPSRSITQVSACLCIKAKIIKHA